MNQSLQLSTNDLAVSEQAMPMISIKNLHKVYQQGSYSLTALNDVSLEVQSGEVFGVLGQSGAGKSTLIRCVNQLEKATSGSIIVNGQQMTVLSSHELRQARQHIGMIFQHFNLLSSRTVLDNVAFPLKVMGYSKRQRRARAEELLVLVGLESKAHVYPAQLSGGQKQRVGIARALAGEPKVLLSDEATSALDPQTTRSILELLRDLNRRMGLTILLITHQMEVVKQICDSVAVLDKGKIVEQGHVVDLVAQTDSFLAQEFFPRRSTYAPRAGTTLATIAFAGQSTSRAIFTALARRFDIDIDILSGSVETVGGQRVGQFHIELEGTDTTSALQYLHELNFAVEVH